ncbi:DoxX family protein [Modestobacter marinus]|uniref:DoxX family protein n=1 Tax=Modestobacter marinus TaxID=477641 RepID=UPI00201A6538|nr:DoxX family protein [Modestobacter marinus]
MRDDVSAQVLAAGMAGSGALHLVRPRTYEWMIPPELGPARPWVTGSGVAELATAALLAVPRTRRLGGWAAVGVLVGVLPAHAQTLRVFRRRPGKLAVAVARIPFQLPMLTAALRVARGR